MKINIDEFNVHKEYVEAQYLKSGVSSLSLYSSTSSCPILAVYYFALEICKEEDKELIGKSIKSVIEFYGYDLIIYKGKEG